MSLLNREPKQNKTKDLGEYHKQYREQHLTHIKHMERVKYFKQRYNIPPDFVEKFGEYTAEVYKIQQEFRKIESQCPELIEHIFNILPKIETI